MGHKGREYIRCFKVTTFEIPRVTLDGPLDRGCFDAVRVRHLYPARFKPSSFGQEGQCALKSEDASTRMAWFIPFPPYLFNR